MKIVEGQVGRGRPPTPMTEILVCPRGHEFECDEDTGWNDTCPCGLPGYRSESEAKAATEDMSVGEWSTGREPLVRAIAGAIAEKRRRENR